MTTNSQLRLDSKNNKWIKSPSSFQGDQIGIRQMPRYLRQGLMAVLFRFNGSTTWMILNAGGLQLRLRMKGGDSPELARWHSCHWVVYPIAWGVKGCQPQNLGKHDSCVSLVHLKGGLGPHGEFQKNPPTPAFAEARLGPPEVWNLAVSSHGAQACRLFS